jgi:hypothetical protein
MKADEGLQIALEETGFSKYGIQNISNDDWSRLQATFQNFLNEKNPIYAKTKMVYEVVNNAISNGCKKNDVESAGVCIEDLIENNNIPADILEELKRWRTRTEETTPTRLTKILNALLKFLRECKSKAKELIYLDVLIEMCKINKSEEDEDNFKKYKTIAKVFIDQIPLTDSSFDEKIKKKISDEIEQKKIFLALSTLRQCCETASLKIFYKHIEQFKDDLKESNPFKELLTAVSKFKINEQAYYSSNSRYEFLSKISISEKGFLK